MQKKGSLHYLAYSLTLDPAEEIRGAITDAAARSWQELQSLDKLVDEQAEGLAAEVRDTQVVVSGAGASYRTAEVELPATYENSYAVATGTEDADPEVTYTDSAWCEAKEAYEENVDKAVQARILNIGHIELYKTSELAERVKNYGICIGSLSFLLYKFAEMRY